MIFHGKDIENRTWSTAYRGPLLIQASSKPDDDFLDAVAYARARGVSIPQDALRYGGIIGQVTLVDYVRHSESPWFMGPVGWVLRDARELPFLPIAGRLGLFDASQEILRSVLFKFEPLRRGAVAIPNEFEASRNPIRRVGSPER
jgi:hypothetical protein